MATDGGPNIERDGLVFGMDNGYGVANNSTATKFYRGGPTENKITNVGVSTTGWSEYGWSGSFVVTSDHENTFELTSTNGWHNATFNHGVSTGTVNVSFEYKLKSKQTTGIWGFVLNGTHLGSYTNWIGSLNSTNLPSLTEWKTFSGTYSGNGDTKLVIGLRGSDSQGLTDTMYVRNLQVENKDHQTPFVNGVRTSTQSLIDLTKSANIDVSNVSFDSTGQPVWDGTDDRSDVTSHSAIEIVDNVSIEYVYKRLSTDPVLDVIANKYHGTGWELFCGNTNKFALAGRNGDGTYYSTGNGGQTMVNNKFYHLVAQKQGTSWRLYVNGELDSSTTANSVGTWSNTGVLQIGGEGNGYFPHMELPVLKIYNRVLSIDEIKQNLNAYKNRFDI